MYTGHMTSKRGFSLIEVMTVVVLIGIIATIAIPKFADAGSGRRLSAAKRTLTADIEFAKVRARATSRVHVLKFYPNENRYIIVEGSAVTREAIVLTRDFDLDPYKLSIARTNLGIGESTVITAFGDLSPGFNAVILDDGIEITVTFAGISTVDVTPTVTITPDEVKDLPVGVLTLRKAP